MKKILFVCLVVSLTACRKNIACFNATAYQVQFFTPSLSTLITDTGAQIIKYAQGSNFLSLVDTLPYMVMGNMQTYSTGIFTQRYVIYTNYCSDIYSTDLLITLYPSGRIYKLTNMAHDRRSISEKSSDNYACSEDITYTVNGAAYEFAGQTYPSGGTGKAIISIQY